MNNALLKLSQDLQLTPPMLEADKLLTPEAKARINELQLKAESFETIGSPKAQQLAADLMKDLHSFISNMEDAAKALRAPYDTLSKNIAGTVKTSIAVLVQEKERIRRMLSDFVMEQNRKAAELQRQQDKLARELEAERERLKNQPVTQQNQAELDKLGKQMGQILQPIEVPKAAGMTAKPTKKFEVLDIRKLYASHPEFVDLEVRTRDLNSFIRNEANAEVVAKGIPGIRVYEEFDVAPR